MILEILTPDKKVFDGSVDAICVPGTSSPFMICNNHAPIISTLGSGTLTINTKDGFLSFFVAGGVVEVHNNQIIVLTTSITAVPDESS